MSTSAPDAGEEVDYNNDAMLDLEAGANPDSMQAERQKPLVGSGVGYVTFDTASAARQCVLDFAKGSKTRPGPTRWRCEPHAAR